MSDDFSECFLLLTSGGSSFGATFFFNFRFSNCRRMFILVSDFMCSSLSEICVRSDLIVSDSKVGPAIVS